MDDITVIIYFLINDIRKNSFVFLTHGYDQNITIHVLLIGFLEKLSLLLLGNANIHYRKQYNLVDDETGC